MITHIKKKRYVISCIEPHRKFPEWEKGHKKAQQNILKDASKPILNECVLLSSEVGMC